MGNPPTARAMCRPTSSNAVAQTSHCAKAFSMPSWLESPGDQVRFVQPDLDVLLVAEAARERLHGRFIDRAMRQKDAGGHLKRPLPAELLW
jgi:hypothetical protein